MLLEAVELNCGIVYGILDSLEREHLEQWLRGGGMTKVEQKRKQSMGS